MAEYEAGRETDALIAQRIMGDPWPLEGLDWHPLDDHWCVGPGLLGRAGGSFVNRFLGRFTEHIADAMELPEKLGDRYCFECGTCSQGHWANFYDEEESRELAMRSESEGFAIVDPREGTLALAICRAALRAVES